MLDWNWFEKCWVVWFEGTIFEGDTWVYPVMLLFLWNGAFLRTFFSLVNIFNLMNTDYNWHKLCCYDIRCIVYILIYPVLFNRQIIWWYPYFRCYLFSAEYFKVSVVNFITLLKLFSHVVTLQKEYYPVCPCAGWTW